MFRGDGWTEQIALVNPATFPPQEIQLRWGLDALRHYLQLQRAGHLDDGSYDCGTGRVAAHAGYETLVDLDLEEGKAT